MPEPKKDETIICPNCGFPATKNYCAQCGQETHLHKETFIGLITHFVGHYFHYDSKFWVTLKTLFTKPGMLTVAYWENKRMRFIPPISLYIFVSIVFFFLFFSTVGSEKILKESLVVSTEDSITNARIADSIETSARLTGDTSKNQIKGRKMVAAGRNPKVLGSIVAKFAHNAPKLFFFMIPLMAAGLSILYRKRKEVYFVDNAVFSLHIHAAIFIMLIPTLYMVPDKDLNWLDHFFSFFPTIIPFFAFLYLIIALHNAYKSSWGRSVINGLVISTIYLVFFFAVAITYFVFVVYVSL